MKSCVYFSLFLLVERRLGEGRGKRQEEEQRWPEESCWWEIYPGGRRWLQKALVAPRVPSSASSVFSGSFHCSEARCKGSHSRYRPPSPSRVRKKPWVRGTAGLRDCGRAGGGRAATLPSVPRNHCFHFLKSKPLRRLPPPPPPPLPRVPPLSLGHLVVVAMETTSKMACKSTQQEQGRRWA